MQALLFGMVAFLVAGNAPRLSAKSNFVDNARSTNLESDY
jgi:hypothetical protein